MVFCCVPQCGIDSWRCDPSITFHDFPSNPDSVAKWVNQINCALKSETLWFPRGKPVICSKHFLSTDFKDDSDTLKPKVLPTVFGNKYIGTNHPVEKEESTNNANKTGPLIVKIKTEDGGKKDIFISGVYSQTEELEAIINEPEYSTPSPTQSVSNLNILQSHKNYLQNNIISTPSLTQSVSDINILQSHKNYLQNKNMCVKYQNSIQKEQCETSNNLINKPIFQNKGVSKKKIVKQNVQKRDNNDSNLIEIGPNTFLKINPDIIKVNKKLTSSGNTVLQFLMDQNLANTIGPDVLPKIVQGAISNIGNATTNLFKNKSVVEKHTSITNENVELRKKDEVVQHVLGHLVDTHVCKESCAQLQEMDNILIETDSPQQEKIPNSTLMDVDVEQQKKIENDLTHTIKSKFGKIISDSVPNENNTISSTIQSSEISSNDKADSNCIAKAPVLMTTNMSLAHCFMEKTKYLTHLRQKARQIASLKQKVTNLNKKIEELEDKCIVQERQLSFSFLKKLRTIRKNASKGDPSATYILEQVRAYTGQKQMRWSDSTLHQCAIWCRKAPYAYEYFKKADFFKLPCLGTVKRYIRKHPEMTFSSKSVLNVGEGDDDSSSDFTFEEEDSMDEDDTKSKEDQSESGVCETVLPEEDANFEHNQQTSYQNYPSVDREDDSATADSQTMEVVLQHEENNSSVQNLKTEAVKEVTSYPVTVEGTNLEIQELILPSGEVVQCYSSNLCNGSETGNQYYIIPSAGDQNSNNEHEYNIVQSESVPVILQNIDSTQLHQEQLIFITNSSDQVECTETEVITAR